MQCELCYHMMEEEQAEVLTIQGEYGEELYWACPDCVSEQEQKEQ